jgi:hypothetical protein
VSGKFADEYEALERLLVLGKGAGGGQTVGNGSCHVTIVAEVGKLSSESIKKKDSFSKKFL